MASLSQESTQGASIGGTYKKLIVFDSTAISPLQTIDVDFLDYNGRSLEKIFNFNPTRKMSVNQRQFRGRVETNTEPCLISIFCRVEDKVTDARLKHELASLNRMFQQMSCPEDRIKFYNNMVNTYFEKMVMSLTYPPKNPNTNKWHWEKYDSVNLRGAINEMPQTDDDNAITVSAIVHRMQAQLPSSSAFSISSRSQFGQGLSRFVSSTPSTSREPTPGPSTGTARKSSEMKPFKPPVKVADARKTRSNVAAETGPNREQIERDSRSQSRAASEAPSEIIAGTLDAEKVSNGISDIKQMLTDIMNLIYDEARRAAKDENGPAFDEIKEDIVALKKDIAVINTKLLTIHNTTQKMSKDKQDFSAEISRIMEGQAKIQKKLHNLGFTMAEKEALSVKMISRIFPIDRLNMAVDVFLSNSFVQDMLLKYLKPSIDGISYGDLDKGISNAILSKMFTQNCRAHMVVGESSSGLSNKMWCKRQMPDFCIKVIDQLVLPYLSKKLKGEAKDHIIQKNVAEVTSRMQVTLSGDRTAFLKKAASSCKTGRQAITEMYNEDCRFYNDNLHLMMEPKPTFEEYYEATKNLAPIKALFEAEEDRGNKEPKRKNFPPAGHVFDSMKIREGLRLETVTEAIELISSAYSTLGGDVSKLYFDPILSLPTMKEMITEAQNSIKENINDVISRWLQSTVGSEKDKEKKDDNNSEDEFVTPAKRKRGGPANSSNAIKKARAAGKAIEPTPNPNESSTPSQNSSAEKVLSSTTDTTPSPVETRAKAKAKEVKEAKKKANTNPRKRSLFMRDSSDEEAAENEPNREPVIAEQQANSSGHQTMEITPSVQESIREQEQDNPPPRPDQEDIEMMHDTDDEAPADGNQAAAK